jgi:hypothetical protein
LAFGDSRRVELRPEPDSWHEQLRTSAIAGKAPNACVQRVRERQWSKHENCASRTPLQRLVRRLSSPKLI